MHYLITKHLKLKVSYSKQTGSAVKTSTSPCPTDSCRNEPIPLESAGMAQESGGMGRNPQEWNRNGTGTDRNGQEWHWNGLKWTFWRSGYNKDFIPMDIVLIYRTTYFSLLFLLCLHLFKSVSQAAHRYCPNLYKYTVFGNWSYDHHPYIALNEI